MAGRPIWSGQLKVSLVSFPIQLFAATNPAAEISFRQLDRKTHQRVHHLNVIDGDRPVDRSDIVKGFEYSKGKYIVLEPDEIKRLRLETQKVLSISQFVDTKQLPPALFEKPYFVVPDPKGPADAFAVMRAALAQSEKAAIGEITFGGREHLIAIASASDNGSAGLMGYTLRYADELRDEAAYFDKTPEHKVDKRELELADQLIQRQTSAFRLDSFKDDYEAALRELIDAKRKNSSLPVSEEKPKNKVISLIDALKQSVQESGTKPRISEHRARRGPRLVKTGRRSRRAA